MLWGANGRNSHLLIKINFGGKSSFMPYFKPSSPQFGYQEKNPKKTSFDYY